MARVIPANLAYWLSQLNPFNYLVAKLDAGDTIRLLGGIFALGKTVPSNTTAGYRKGCVFIHWDAVNHSDALYVNIGTYASCNFNAVTVAAD